MPLLKEVAAVRPTQPRDAAKSAKQSSTNLTRAEDARAARAWAEALSLGGDLSCADPVDEEC
ncbi:MAG TPA: hypothetical protein VHB25_10525 [Gemmatimonadaceae bacterium]|nr:hypothetical protein [Gemmatimonadaceae bacterium]